VRNGLIADLGLRIADFGLRIADWGFRIADWELLDARCWVLGAGYGIAAVDTQDSPITNN
ncbi:MAG: hypothetical protein WBF93_02280, partial [Pirellulales bacterium]